MFLNLEQPERISFLLWSPVKSSQIFLSFDLQNIPEIIDKKIDFAGLSLGQNPYRCDCDNRFRMQSWLIENIKVIADVKDIFCIENITEAFLKNDTTILSAYPPNIGHEIYAVPMLQFIENINKLVFFLILA